MILSTKELHQLVELKYPHMWRNNRGGRGKVRYGIPFPKNKEIDSDMKGGDYIGFMRYGHFDAHGEIITRAIFMSIEIKSLNDKVKEGQIKWHNYVIENGGKSIILFADRTELNNKTSITQVKEIMRLIRDKAKEIH